MNFVLKDAESIARELLAEIASEWIDTPTTRCVEEDGSYIFVFTLPPAKVISDGRVVKRPAAISTFHFNPLAEATEIVRGSDLRFPTGVGIDNAGMSESVLREITKPKILQMLRSASDVFTDAMWQARIIADTLCAVETMSVFGRQDITRLYVNSTLDMIREKMRERIGPIHQARNPKITESSISTALRSFFPKFRETGEIPSQRQFAKTVGVTAKAWRDYLKKNQLGKHESIITRWFEYMLTSDPDV
jgi:hypothetical protein